MLNLPLKAVALLQNGIFLPPVPDGPVAMLQISDFGPDGKLVHVPKGVKALSQRQQRHFLQPGDVLLGGKGDHTRAFLYPPEFSPAVASTVFLVLRLTSSALTPEYLQWWLNLDTTQAGLQLLGQGSKVKSISMEALADIEIPLPGLEQQDLILHCQALLNRERQLLEGIAEKRFLIGTSLLIESIKK